VYVIIFHMEGVDALLKRYSELLDDVIDAISHSDLDKVSKYVWFCKMLLL